VCWQLPLRLEHKLDENEHATYVLREWKRRDWGEGGRSSTGGAPTIPRHGGPPTGVLRSSGTRSSNWWAQYPSRCSSIRCGDGHPCSFFPILPSRSGPEPPTGSQMRAFTAEELQKASLEEGMIFPDT
jgi:hypothetical protein